MTLIGRPRPLRVNPPGTISSVGQNRSLVMPPGLIHVPQPTASVGAPGRGPGFALSDHIHAGGAGSGPTPPPPNPHGAIRTDAGSGSYTVGGGGNASDTGIVLGTAPFSFRLWIQPTTGTSQVLTRIGDADNNNYFALALIDATHIQLSTSGGNSPEFFNFVVPNLTDGNWHQLVATYAAGTFMLYDDNVVIGSWVHTAHTASSPQGLIPIGYATDNTLTASNPGIHLGLDHADYLNYALSPSQISVAYGARNSGATIYANTVIAQAPIRYYKLDDVGSTMTDYGSQGVNGTYQSGASQGVPGI